MDVALLPHVNNFSLLFKEFYPSSSLFKAIQEEDKDLLSSFEKYYLYASQRPSFQNSNY
jgi:hypothetical protein